jgi:hypothetical protein
LQALMHTWTSVFSMQLLKLKNPDAADIAGHWRLQLRKPYVLTTGMCTPVHGAGPVK